MRPNVRIRVRSAAVLCTVVAGCAVIASHVVVRGQSLDPSFNPGARGAVLALAVQQDGKILVGGLFETLGRGVQGPAARNNIGRLHADGTLDARFDPGANDKVAALAVQPDGKILVGGAFTTLGGGGSGKAARRKIGRLNADGSLDTSFNAGVTGDRVNVLAVQADGKILVGGTFTAFDRGGTDSRERANLARLNADGSLDASFNPGAQGDAVTALVIQADGKILVSGWFKTLGGGPRSHIGRLNPDGSLDAGFDPGANGPALAMAVQADGKILLGGWFSTLGGGGAGTTSRFNIGRLNADGSLDTRLNPGTDAAVLALAVQADGKIVVGGQFTRLGGGRWGKTTRNYLGRLNPDGSLDVSFNPGANEGVWALAAQADKKIVVGGTFDMLGGGEIGTTARESIGRLNADAAASSVSPISDRGLPASGQARPFLGDPSGLTGVTATNGIERPVTIRVVYDNYVKTEGLTSDWGYAIVVEGLDKTVLFDTGQKSAIFESNFKKMGLNPDALDALVLSHEHEDHTGGIRSLARLRNGIPILLPYSFSDVFKKRMDSLGLKPVLVNEPARICANLYTSGEFDHQIPEQALVLNTKQGLVVMTGCSHPGIVEMLRAIKTAFKKDISTVFGGFHLLNKSDAEMNTIIAEMKALGVARCGATHCTGDKQIAMIKSAFGANYFELGVGNTIAIK